MKRLLLIFLLCAGSAGAADAVINSYNVGAGGDGLGAPRHQLAASTTAGEFYYYRPYYSTNRATLFLFQDYGESLVDTVIYNNGGPTTAMSDHSHMIQRGDTIWITDNEYETIPSTNYTNLAVYRYSAVGDNLAFIDSTGIDTAGFDEFIGAPALLYDTLFLIVRSSGGESNMSITWAKGLAGNYAWQGDLYAFNSVNVRLKACLNGDSIFIPVWYSVAAPNYGDLYAFLYHDGAWDTVGAAFDNTLYLSRDISGIVGREGELRVTVADTADPSSIYCFWLHPDSASWVKETIHTSDKKEEDGANNRGMRNNLVYTHYDGALRCLFSSSTGEDNALDRKVYCSKYNYSTHAWGTPLSVADVDSVKEITAVEYVPASHGSTIYAYYNYTSGSSTGHAIVTIQDAEATPLGETAGHAILRGGTYRGMRHAD